MNKLISFIFLISAILPSLSAGVLSDENLHAEFTAILKEYCHESRVDYKLLKKNRNKLNNYIATLAKIDGDTFQKWTNDERMAFLINYYNAATLQLIIDHYPVTSIKDIGGFFSSPWKIEFITLFGEKHNLDYIEHELLRKKFKEPKIHFALVCASIGCPPLRNEAFTGSELKEQLNDQASIFLKDKNKNYWDSKSKTLYLSPIFKWFEADFEKQSGLVYAYIQSFLPEEDRAEINKLTRGNPRIKYTKYDWGLNIN